ncbi:hypothetical protein ACLB1G_19840 [Oxalobacteraceae bacterium A2-2]
MRKLTALLLAGAAGAALADDAALLRCRQLPDGPERLRCYNAIPVGAPATPTAPTRAQQESSFGREQAVIAQQQLSELSTTIAGEFEGWKAGARIRLANGQVWQIADDSEEWMPPVTNPRATLRRGTLGAIFLDIEGAPRAPRVRRVK